MSQHVALVYDGKWMSPQRLVANVNLGLIKPAYWGGYPKTAFDINNIATWYQWSRVLEISWLQHWSWTIINIDKIRISCFFFMVILHMTSTFQWSLTIINIDKIKISYDFKWFYGNIYIWIYTSIYIYDYIYIYLDIINPQDFEGIYHGYHGTMGIHNWISRRS